MIDRVSFAPPLGFLGRIVERLVLAKYMRRLIEQRTRFFRASTDKWLETGVSRKPWVTGRRDSRHNKVPSGQTTGLERGLWLV
jgi:hypothetical protein